MTAPRGNGPEKNDIMPGIVAILPAAGFGTRMGGESPKQFRLLDGVPVLLFTLRATGRVLRDH